MAEQGLGSSTLRGLDRIERLSRPRSIAIVGASRDPEPMASGVIPALSLGGFSRKIFPVDPGYEEIGGHRCYMALADIPEPVDRCVIAVGEDRVADILRQCRAKDAGGAIVVRG